eukprot:10975945-Alexandrium_andersonii.AAC.1
MSASLVGSEMCIRDSCSSSESVAQLIPAPPDCAEAMSKCWGSRAAACAGGAEDIAKASEAPSAEGWHPRCANARNSRRSVCTVR